MRWPGYVTILAAAAVIAAQVFVPPTVGLANNGDFGKVIGIFGIGAPNEDEYHFADTTYRSEPHFHFDVNFRSSEMLLAGLGIKTFTRGETFDLRWMGLIHGLLLLASVILLQPCLYTWPVWRRLAASAAMLFVFGDVMYVALLNSFYMDTAALLFLLLAVVAFVRTAMWGRKFDYALFVIASTLAVTSKAQHAPLGLVLAGLCFALCKQRVAATTGAIVVLIATAMGWKSVPPEYASYGVYSVVFYQVLPHSQDVSGDLSALGLDDSFKKWIGTHAYDNKAGMRDEGFVRNFSQRTPYSRLGWFFLTHPRDAYLATITSLNEAGRQRPPLGNFDKGAGLPEWTESNRFALWSSLKRSWFYLRGERFLTAIAGLQAVFCWMVWWQRKRLGSAIIAGASALGVSAILSLGIATLADAVEVTRHYLIPFLLLDLQLIVMVVTFLFTQTSKQQPEEITNRQIAEAGTGNI